MPEFSALVPAAGSNGRTGCETASVGRNNHRALRRIGAMRNTRSNFRRNN